MGLFNRLFGPKQEAPPESINTSFHTMEEFARSIMAHYGAEHFQGDTQAKQVLSLYCFGGLGALAIQHKMSPPQAHAVALALLNSFLVIRQRMQQQKRKRASPPHPTALHISIPQSTEVLMDSCVGRNTETRWQRRISPRLWLISRRQRHEG